MNVIVLPIELTGLHVNRDNVSSLTYSLAYYYASDCIEKDPLNNSALELLTENDAVGNENDSIYEKFIPLSKVNFIKEKDELGFDFNIPDYEFTDWFVTSELVFQKWYELLRLEQKVDYKIRSLIDYHRILPNQIDALAQDCESTPFKDRGVLFLTLMCDLWDNKHYSVSDDNIVWGVGFSEIEALFSAIENHLWLSKNHRYIDRENKESGKDESEWLLNGIKPYEDTAKTFMDMLELMQGSTDVLVTQEGLELLPCTERLFHLVNEKGLLDFDFCIRKGFIDLAEE